MRATEQRKLKERLALGSIQRSVYDRLGSKVGGNGCPPIIESLGLRVTQRLPLLPRVEAALAYQC